jgi:hypothetical protein
MRKKTAPRFKRQRVDEHITTALIDFANDADRVQFRDWAMKLIAREPDASDSVQRGKTEAADDAAGPRV